MPSSSTHDTHKERLLSGAYIRAHVRLYHASQLFLITHLTTAFAAVLELEEAALEAEISDAGGQAIVAAEEKLIGKISKRVMVLGAADLVEDVARDVVGEFGAVQQEVLYQLAGKIGGVAGKMVASEIAFVTIHG